MAQNLGKTFQLLPRQLLLQPIRSKGKINIQKPKQPFFLRTAVNEFLEPYYESRNPIRNLEEACLQQRDKALEKKKIVPHEYELFLAREFLNWFNKSKMIGFFNRTSMTASEQFELKVALRRSNMYMKFIGHRVLFLAIKGTKFEVLESILRIPPMIVFSPDTDVNRLAKIMKKFPKYTLMAGILDDRLLNLNDFLKYGQTDLVDARVGLVQTLQNAAGSYLSRQLVHHQSNLCNRLDMVANVEDK